MQNTNTSVQLKFKQLFKLLSDQRVVSVRETKTQLPLSALRKVWGEAVSYICGLKEDYIRLYQGQRAGM